MRDLGFVLLDDRAWINPAHVVSVTRTASNVREWASNVREWALAGRRPNGYIPGPCPEPIYDGAVLSLVNGDKVRVGIPPEDVFDAFLRLVNREA